MVFFNSKRFGAIIILLLLTISVSVHAQVSEANRKLVMEVGEKIFAAVKPDEIPKGYKWPPKLEIDPSSDVNAYATLGPHSQSDTEFQPQVVFLNGLLIQLVRGDADYLAYITGHEVAHIIHGDCRYNPATDGTGFLRATFTREQEIVADTKGMELALRAGYSYRKALLGVRRMADEGFPYSSFEGLGVNHPSWKDRISYIDKEQPKLWQAMSAFDNGNVFLMMEQYVAAERCFRQVTREFPSCHEAWANMGYAQLMRYCDGLETDDLRRFDLGQIVAGGFYRRPKSLEILVRGVDEKLWWDAVGSLNRSLQLNPDQPLVKANLGIAYLVHPGGANVGIGDASRFFTEAIAGIEKDSTIGPLERAAVLLNAGVMNLAEGNLTASAAQLESAAKASGQEFDSRGNAIILAGQIRRIEPTAPITAALLYNSAQLLAKSNNADDRKKAAELLELYLNTASRASTWWPIAYEQYAKLSSNPKDSKEFGERISEFRPLTSVTLASGEVITLSSALNDVIQELGEGEELPIVVNTTLKRITYSEHGVSVLATGEVVAIALQGPKAPELKLRLTGLGAGEKSIKLGMDRDDLDELLADEVYDFRPLTDSDVYYRFYRNLGLAVRVQSGEVVEILVVQIPED